MGSGWEYYTGSDELRWWNPGSSKPVHVIISSGGIEILVDMDGEIQEIIIGNASQRISLDDIQAIAEIIDDNISTGKHNGGDLRRT